MRTADLMKATTMTALFWGISSCILVPVYRCSGEEVCFSINTAYEILDSERERKFFSMVKYPHHLWGPYGALLGYFER